MNAEERGYVVREYHGRRFYRPNVLEILAVVVLATLGLIKGGALLTLAIIGVSVIAAGASTSLHKWRLRIYTKEIELKNRWVTMRFDATSVRSLKRKGFYRLNEKIQIHAVPVTVAHTWSKKKAVRERIEIPDVFIESLKTIESALRQNLMGERAQM